MRGRGRGTIARPTPHQDVDPEDPHFVHDEVKELAAVTKNVIKQNFKRHGTSEQDILAGIKNYGVSEQSKAIMSREAQSAQLAMSQGIYVVYRNEYAKNTSRDFCSRIGPGHKCFCGHTLAEHMPQLKRSAKGYLKPPACSCCGCEGFRYIPNEPEEIGEHWLSRRKDFIPGNWAAKCKCGHTHLVHDPRRGGKCKQCSRCYSFESNFLCVVCDQKWECHETVFEREQEREQAGLPVREAYFPLSDVDPELRDLVFNGPTSKEKLGITSSVAEGATVITLQPSNAVPATQPLKELDEYQQALKVRDRERAERSGVQPKQEDDLPPYCGSCATIFRSEKSKFCSKCGAPRYV